ncbi:MAG TPA: hypothetical protein VJG30_03410 [Candidatus Nanoarchaeia archaeon]|nr:hypothetical protein [Candidatus Nanoarchaeia archaeon]
MADSDIVEINEIFDSKEEREKKKQNTNLKPERNKNKNDIALKAALTELSHEINELSKERRRLEKGLSQDRKKTEVRKLQETQLRDKISKLASMENQLFDDIVNKEHKLSDIKEKLTKIRAARTELTGI